ncbi:MAG: triose-phosphate isomerase, partial [Alphaproteobacteria bacterium]|nr:triose-phosphate isomerase [Alphaproteobacteria bacterium]
MRRKLAAGNWKMNGTTDTLREVKALTDAHPDPLVDMLLCPPATLLAQMAWARGTHALQIGGQDCHAA